MIDNERVIKLVALAHRIQDASSLEVITIGEALLVAQAMTAQQTQEDIFCAFTDLVGKMDHRLTVLADVVTRPTW